ncbi:MAG: OmpA family protein [Chitinophagaceae bacterium]
MKRILPIVFLFLVTATMAQDTTSMGSMSMSVPSVPKIVKDHYTVSGGLLGAVNIDKFRLKGSNPTNAKYDFKTGWAGGLWLNFPLGNVISLEPQVMFSEYDYRSNITDGSQYYGKIDYISVPVLLKIHAGHALAFTLGPQFDFVTKVKDNNTNFTKESFKQNSTSISGGIEIIPHGRLTFFGRYIYGLTDMDVSNSSTAAEYRNNNIQAGVKVKLFGRHVPADSDGDGVADPDDKCKSEFGYKRYDGCPIPDKDGDGINDEVDKCPDQPGTVKYNGCPIPDKDGDGINDEVDKCPDQPGTAKYNGCPVPDTDGDGINDELDKCPTQAGTAKYNGCPIPDTDGDGVNDEMDLCPDKAGPASSKGCPVEQIVVQITADFKNILFDNAKATIRPESESILARAAAVMNEQIPNSSFYIDGYTDNVGGVAYNKKLSQARAQAVANALVKNGIDRSRVIARGFGKDNPICDNKTADGRQCNRRVEVVIRNVNQQESQKSIKVNP